MVEPSEQLQLVFDKAIKDAKKLQHEYVTIEHLLLSMLCVETFFNSLKEINVDVEYVKTNLEHFLKANCDDLIIQDTKFKPKKTQAVERILNRAFTQTLFAGRTLIELKDVLLSILHEKKTHAYFFLEKGGLNKEKYRL